MKTNLRIPAKALPSGLPGYVEALRKRGHVVRVVSTGKPESDKYIVKTKVYPFINNIVKSDGFTFARIDEPVVSEAFKGADIIHFIMPFKLSYTALKIAQEMNIPVFSAFQCQPENATYNLGFKRFPILAEYIYGRYNRISLLQKFTFGTVVLPGGVGQRNKKALS